MEREWFAGKSRAFCRRARAPPERRWQVGLPKAPQALSAYQRRIAVSISHSTRCFAVAERFTDTRRTRLAPARCVTTPVSNPPGLLLANPDTSVPPPARESRARAASDTAAGGSNAGSRIAASLSAADHTGRA